MTDALWFWTDDNPATVMYGGAIYFRLDERPGDFGMARDDKSFLWPMSRFIETGENGELYSFVCHD